MVDPNSSNQTMWKPIETAPKDKKRVLYLARFDESGKLQELDFDGTWEYWQESYEMPHINGYDWCSASGIEEPTHWAYQDEPIPMTSSQQPADKPRAWLLSGHGYAPVLREQPNPPEPLTIDEALKIGWIPLYDRPKPAAQWVGLTLEERQAICDKGLSTWGTTVATEAKLREKNHG